MHRYFIFFDYYLETFAKRLSGKNITNPINNGEYKILEELIKQSKAKLKKPFVFIDGGANVGDYSKKVDELCKKHKKKKLYNFSRVSCSNNKFNEEKFKKNKLSIN